MAILPAAVASSDSEDNAAIDRHTLLTRIMAMMGTPYASRGDDTTGFDCSGFTSTVYNQCLGVTLPRSSIEQYSVGEPVRRGRLKFGDLVFFRTNGRSASHVGIYVGNGLFAHASVSLGVTISLLSSSYYKHRYLGARRVVE